MRSATSSRVLYFQGEVHAARGAELVDEDLRSGIALDVLKKERRTTGGNAGLADAVGNLGDFENGIDFGADFLQFAGAVERGNPVA